MELKIKKTNTITDIASWFRFAEPKGGEKQWREGRSAMEFARYMTSSKGKLPKQIEDYLKTIGIKDKSFTCFPEQETTYSGYDLGDGGGRNHDGLLVSDSVVIGIEAKVSESFDIPVREKIAAAVKKNGGENTVKRIKGSLKMITGKDYTSEEDAVGNLMYQLISATVGTIIEAKNMDRKKAVVLIVEFCGDVEDYGKPEKFNEEVAANQKAYEDYLNFLGLSGKSDENRFLEIRGIKVWFKKIRIEVKRDVSYQ